MIGKVNEITLRSLYRLPILSFIKLVKSLNSEYESKNDCVLCASEGQLKLWDGGGNSSKGTWGLNLLIQKELARCIIMIRQCVHQGQSCIYQMDLKGVKEAEKLFSFLFVSLHFNKEPY